jgi:outer membrane protein assembly factor BamB/tetratricopeptide (TPR) repeat protein
MTRLCYSCLLLVLCPSPLRSQNPEFQLDIEERLVAGPMAPPKAATLATDRQARRKLEAAADFIKHRQWPEAVRLLQQVLDSAEDAFVEQPTKAHDGRKTRRLLGARAEAERLLGTLPRQGMEFYHLRYAAAAGERLAAAKRNRDAEGLAETARRYFHTPAGGEALGRLGLHHLDRGRPTIAARCFQRLLQRADSDQLPAITLFHAAVAFHSAGDSDNAERVWQRIVARVGNEGMRLGERLVPLDQLRRYLDAAPRERDPSDWLLFRGQPSRAGGAGGEWPYLEPRWRIDTAQRDDSERWLAHALHLQAKSGLPVLPGSVPLVIGGRIVFRSYDGVRAVDLRSGQEFWRAPMPLALDSLMDSPGRKVQFNNWMWSYTGHFHLVYENAVLGSLSADQQRVYAIEDLPVPPHPQIMLQVHADSYPLGPLQSAAFHNRLRAIDLETGRLLWERGGAGNELDALCDGFFLGAPLPLAGKLYSLFEKRGDVQLICLDADSGALAWSQTLASAADQTTLNLCRRMRAAPLAYADGVLVCPTNAGAVVGVDLVSRSLLWAKTYDLRVGVPSEDYPNYDPHLQLASWRYCAPLIRDGKVVLASPDGDALLCLNLRDGELLWQTHRAEDDLYVACIQHEKLIVVGRGCCRALHLKDGIPAWQIATGLPSGLGAHAGDVYYLPLQRGAVCALDLESGRNLGCTASPRGEAPGNLVFAQGNLVSQSAVTLAVYPTLQERLAFLDAAPNRGAALLQRGRLRLNQDDFLGAAQDFRAVLSTQPTVSLAAKARDGLHETLTRLLLHNPGAIAQHLDEYRALCRLSIPENATARQRARLEREEQGRQVNLLRLVAMAHEQQGRPLDALRTYQQLHAREAGSELTPTLEDAALRARLDVWVEGRVFDLLARAKPAERAALEAEVDTAWRQARAAPNRDGLVRFVALFGECGTRGQEARLTLAERLIEDDGPGRALEAEQHLLLLLRPGSDRGHSARALEALVRLMLRRGLPEDALHYYRLLHRDRGEVELQSDKRFLTLLQDAPPAWANRRLRFVEPTAENPQQPPPEALGMPIGFEPELDPSRAGTPFDTTPSLRRHRLLLDVNPPRIVLAERASGRICWQQAINPPKAWPYLNQLGQMNLVQTPARYRLRGHLAVISLGVSVVAIDLLDRRVVWWRDLVDVPVGGELLLSPARSDGNLEAHSMFHARGSFSRLARIGPLTSRSVPLLTRRGLEAVDPMTGTALWSREDVPSLGDWLAADDFFYGSDEGRSFTCRARDGRAGPPPLPFGTLIGHASPAGGASLLVSENEPSAEVVQRRYDVRTGKDLWLRRFPAGSLVLHSEDPAFAGTIDPTGNVTILDGVTGKEMLHAAVNVRHLEKIGEARLFLDRQRFYIALSESEGPLLPGMGAPGQLCVVQRYLHPVSVNGTLYAFDRATGRRCWFNALAHQMVLLDQIDDLPILLCLIGRQEPVGGGGMTQVIALSSIDKATGKFVVLDKTVPNQGNPFHALMVKKRQGTIDLVNANGSQLRHAIHKP